MECAEKTGLPGFGFLLEGDNPALRGKKTAPEGRVQLAGSKDGVGVYTNWTGSPKWKFRINRIGRQSMAKFKFPTPKSCKLKDRAVLCTAERLLALYNQGLTMLLLIVLILVLGLGGGYYGHSRRGLI